MRLKVSFFGFVLALIGFLLPSIILVALLPSLINADPVKARFVKELENWTGSTVQLAGPVSIESFFSLSLNARDVEFTKFSDALSGGQIRAGQIVARVDWTDLLLGNLDFDKIKISDATIHLPSIDESELAMSLAAVLTSPNQMPFAAVVLQNCEIIFDREGKARRVVRIENLVANHRQSDHRLEVKGTARWDGEDIAWEVTTRGFQPSLGDDSVPLLVQISSPRLTASFDGTAKPQNWSAEGQFSLTTPNAAQLSYWLGVRSGVEIPDAVNMSGMLELSPQQLLLKSGNFVLAGEEASGNLTILPAAENPQIEGSLAFDELDLAKLLVRKDGGPLTAVRKTQALAGFARKANVDLRVSVKHLRWDALIMGKAAFTLGRRAERLSAEIAHLELFGGSILGHAEADLRKEPPTFNARFTASNVDAAQLLMMVSPNKWLDAQVNANIDAEAEGWSAAELLKSATANAQVEFPGGGQIQLDILQLAQSASAQGQNGWTGGDLVWQPFNTLRLNLLLKDKRLLCDDLSLLSGASLVAGSGEVDLTKRNFDWRLDIQMTENPGEPSRSAQSSAEKASTAELSITGPWAYPAIRSRKVSGRFEGGESKRPGG